MVIYFYLVLILHFVVFNLSKNFLVSRPFFRARRTAKLQHFFELPKYFKKNISFFLSNICCFVSQAISLDCGCKGTTFFQTTKIFLSFFLNFFISHCFSKRKIFILPLFLCLKTCFYPFFRAFLPIFRA